MVNIEELLGELVRRDGSDLHLKVGSPPVFRVKRKLIFHGQPPLSEKDTKDMAYSLMNEYQRNHFEREKDVDFAYSVQMVGRFRVNVFRQRGSIGMVARRVKTRIPTFTELSLPPVLEKISMCERGIVLVSGTSSSGKSTTLASIIDYVNSNRKCHVMTLEDPIEYLHVDKESVINQREIGLDTESFRSALRHVVRQDPDVIVVGEMRDSETFGAAVAASETGHMVFSTLHASDTTHVVDRILEFFPLSQHSQIRLELALNLRAATCQRLMPRADGSGVIPAVEVMVATPTIVKLIRDNRVMRLLHVLHNSADVGMQTFNQSLVELINKGLITEDVAMANSSNPEMLQMNLKGIFLDEDKSILGEDDS